MINDKEKKQKKGRGRIAKVEAIASLSVYLKPATYEKIKSKAIAKYTTMAALAKQVISKIVKHKENV